MSIGQSNLFATNNNPVLEKNLWIQNYIIEHSPDMINILDENGVILYNNGALDNSFHDTIGKSLASLVSPFYRERIDLAIKRVVSTGKTESYEVPSEDGSVWYMSSLAPIYEDGKLMAIMVMIRDITQLKKTEKALNQMNTELKQRVNELKALYDITSISSEQLELEELLKKSLHIALHTVGCETGIIHIFNLTSNSLEISAKEECRDGIINALEQTSFADQILMRVFTDQEIIRYHGIEVDSNPPDPISSEPGLDYVGVPIRAKGQILGVLSIFNQGEREFDPNMEKIIQTIADQLGLAIETTRLRKQSEDAIAFNERQRLAHNLHDSVSQSLFGLVLAADAGMKLLQIKDFANLNAILENITKSAYQSLKEIRLLIYELRPNKLVDEGLAQAINLRMKAVECRSGINAQLRITGDEYIPPLIAREIFAIVNEGLNNSLKHAAASHIIVLIEVDPEKAVTKIIDDGRGFSLNERDLGGLGLDSMKERAEKLGGALLIDTSPGEGTKIIAEIPINLSREVDTK